MNVVDIDSPQYQVLEALKCLCSQNASLLKVNETKLAEWEVQAGFYPIVTSVSKRIHRLHTSNLRRIVKVLLMLHRFYSIYPIVTQIIFAYQNVETNVRWMATVYLKNGITKYWRKNAPK